MAFCGNAWNRNVVATAPWANNIYFCSVHLLCDWSEALRGVYFGVHFGPQNRSKPLFSRLNHGSGTQKWPILDPFWTPFWRSWRHVAKTTDMEMNVVGPRGRSNKHSMTCRSTNHPSRPPALASKSGCPDEYLETQIWTSGPQIWTSGPQIWDPGPPNPAADPRI